MSNEEGGAYKLNLDMVNREGCVNISSLCIIMGAYMTIITLFPRPTDSTSTLKIMINGNDIILIERRVWLTITSGWHA